MEADILEQDDGTVVLLVSVGNPTEYFAMTEFQKRENKVIEVHAAYAVEKEK